MKFKIAFTILFLSIGTTDFAMQRTVKPLSNAALLTQSFANCVPKYEQHIEIISSGAWRQGSDWKSDLQLKEVLQECITKQAELGWELMDVESSMSEFHIFWTLLFKRELPPKQHD